MGRGSHREDEKVSITFLITLTMARRTAGSQFEVASVLKNAPGTLTYNVGNDFVKGEILWSMVSYD
jgi:transposase-like protein